MADLWLPWESYPGLTQDRLLKIGDIIRTARTEALESYHPEKGETHWTLGTSQYERMKFAIIEAQQQYSWIRVISGDGLGPRQFVFTIGDHAVRACRGDDEEVASRYQEPCIPEIEYQFVLIALEKTPPAGRFLRIAIENGSNCAPLHIYLDELDSANGKPIRNYLIPVLATVLNEIDPPVEAVEIEPVIAEPVEDEGAKETEDAPVKKTGSDE